MDEVLSKSHFLFQRSRSSNKGKFSCLDNCPVYNNFTEIAGPLVKDFTKGVDDMPEPASVHHYGNDTTVTGILRIPCFPRSGCSLEVNAAGPKAEEVMEKIEKMVEEYKAKYL